METTKTTTKELEGRVAQLEKELHNTVQQLNHLKESSEEKERIYSLILESTGTSNSIFDTDCKLILQNSMSRENLGLGKKSGIGLNVFELFGEEKGKEIFERMNRVIANTQSEVFETKFILPTGEKWFKSTYLPVFDEFKNVISVHVISQDITKEKNNENEILASKYKVEESEAKYHALYDNAPLAYQSLDENGCFIDVNPMWLKTLGYERDEIIGKWYGSYLHPDYVEHFKINFPAFKARGYVSDVQFRMRKKSGNYIDVSFEGCVGYTPEGEFKQTYCVFKDISEQKIAENFLKKREAQLKTIMDNSPDTIMQVDKNGRIIYINKLIPGLTNEKVIGSEIYNWIPESNIHIVKKALDEAFNFKRSYEYESEGPSPDSSSQFYNVRVNPVIIDGKTETAIYMATNITERKKNEIDLKESQLKFSKIFNHAPVLISITDFNDGTYLDVNDFAVAFTGFSREEIIGQKSHEIGWISKENRDLLTRTIVENEKIENLEMSFLNKSGDTVFGIVNGEKIILDNRECLLTITTDITERKIAEKALLESEEKLKEAQRIAKIGIFYLNLSNSELTLSKECYEINEINDNGDPEKLIEILKSKLIPDDLNILEHTVIKAISNFSGFSLDYRINCNIGIKNVQIIAEPVKNNENLMIGLKGTLQDITERKSVEEALIQAETNHKRFMDELTLGIRILSKDGKTVYVNNALLEIYGFDSIEEFHNTHVSRRYTPEEFIRHQSRKDKRRLGENITSNYEIDIIHKNGKIRNLQVIRKEIIWDKTLHYQVIYQDITERKQFEKELLIAKEKAEESDHLKSSFLQNMSHEVRTPLNAIVGFTRIMAKPNQPTEKLNKYADVVATKSDQLIGIITDVIEISQIQAKQARIKLSEFDIISLIDNLISPFLKLANSKNIDTYLDLNFSQAEYLIISDQEKIKKIFTHIAENAIKFTLQGSVKVKCEIVKNNLEFTISDTGIGIAENMQEVIFEPFRQVEAGISRKFGGNGLGLTIVKAYTEQLGGTISLKSELNKGTSITVKIPVNVPKRQIQEENIDFTSKAYTILIAEDEYSNYQYLLELFDGTGIDIIHVTNGKEAVDLMKTNDTIGLILMDIKMPILDGQAAAKLIKQFKPSIPIIAQTAYALGNEIESYSGDFDAYITKPIDEDELKQIINKYIEY
jgi:PAS domain S-box-containing protein